MSSRSGHHDQLLELRSRVAPWVGEVLARSAALGFLGAMSLADQVDHALGFVLATENQMEDRPRSVVDLGTGGGIPGLVLISCWPDCRFLLLDANERRTEFLSHETHGRPGGVEVIRGRAEELGRSEKFRHQFDLVTSRSFGTPAVTAECGSPLLSVGGLMVVSEPPDEDPGVRWPGAGLSLLGLKTQARERLDDRFGYQVLVKSEPTADRYPRRVGIPSKRPLF